MTIRTAHIIMLSLGVGGLALSAQAAPNKISSGMGHDLAQAMCTSCHLIEPGQKNPPDHVGGPAFQTIANKENVTAAKLREHLLTTRATGPIPLSMPNPGLSQDELNKLVAYIMSLKSTDKH